MFEFVLGDVILKKMPLLEIKNPILAIGFLYLCFYVLRKGFVEFLDIQDEVEENKRREEEGAVYMTTSIIRGDYEFYQTEYGVWWMRYYLDKKWRQMKPHEKEWMLRGREETFIGRIDFEEWDRRENG